MHRSRMLRTQSSSTGRKFAPDSPPTITQLMPDRSSAGSGPSSGSNDRKRIAAGAARRWSARRAWSSSSIDVPTQTLGSGSSSGKTVATGRMDHTVPIRFSGYAGMDVGLDNGAVVDLSYEDKKPFRFTGSVKKVVFDIQPHLPAHDEGKLHKAARHGHAAHALSQ